MRFPRGRAIGVAFIILALVGACGKSKSSSGTGSSTSSTAAASNNGSITIGSEKFSESIIVAELYAQALEAKGVKVTRKLRLGTREIYEPALEAGEIDLVPDYAATMLEFLNKGAGEASPDPQATVLKLRERLTPKGLTALEPSGALDANAFAVTKETAAKYNLKTLSDLAPVAGQLTFGAPAECPTRPYCGLGLEKTYGIKFKAFKALDYDGPLTKGALKSGEIQVGELATTDGTVEENGFVILEDDKHLQNADVLTPIARTKALNDTMKSVLNAVSAKLTTKDLAALDKRADVDKEDPEAVAKDWIKTNGFAK